MYTELIQIILNFSILSSLITGRYLSIINKTLEIDDFEKKMFKLRFRKK